MCKFFSCVITRDGNVIWAPEVDDHTKLIEMAGLKDDTADKHDMKFARVEITPPFNQDNYTYDYFAGLEDWSLTIDEEIKPTWWHKSHEIKCLNALKECADKIIIQNKMIDDISRGRYFINNCDIRNITGGQIFAIKDSEVRKLGGNSHIIKSYNTDFNSIEDCSSISEFNKGNIETILGGHIYHLIKGTVSEFSYGYIEIATSVNFHYVVGGYINEVNSCHIDTFDDGYINNTYNTIFGTISGGVINNMTNADIKFFTDGNICNMKDGNIAFIKGGTITTTDDKINSHFVGNDFIIMQKNNTDYKKDIITTKNQYIHINIV